MAAGRYDRWLKNAEHWALEDDWDPTEYLKWVTRLAEAKAKLDDTYRNVDGSLVAQAEDPVRKHEELVRQGKGSKPYPEHAPSVSAQRRAKLIVRYIIAYNFFARATFEEVPDNSLVRRIQHHLVDLEIGMLDVDIAHMLQCAADKVPLKEAVRNRLLDLVKWTGESSPVIKAYSSHGFSLDSQALFVHRLNETRVGSGLPDRAKIPAIIEQAKKDWPEDKYNPFANEAMVKNVVKALDSDEKLGLFLGRCAEPMLVGDTSDDLSMIIIEDMIASGGLDSLLDTAAAWEKKYCSWDATVGPALKAIRRLGRTSAGKDAENLAKYAQTHQKPRV